MRIRVACFVFFAGYSLLAAGQTPQGLADAGTDIDPLSLQVLQQALEPLQQAKAYSFRALVSHEQEGTNGQVITLFHITEASVEKPDKLHLSVHRSGKEVQLFYSGEQAVLYSPQSNLFTTLETPSTLDAALEALDQKNIFIPIRNFIGSDPYKSLSDSLRTGYVVGRVNLFEQPVHHLAFTEPDAEWQLWVIGGEEPRVRRLQVVDKSSPMAVRTTVEFLNWTLGSSTTPETFTFRKPADAKEIEMLPNREGP
jgi:hypothetical protein